MKINSNEFNINDDYIPVLWIQFMNDTLSIFSLLDNVDNAQDEGEINKVHECAKGIKKSIIKRSLN